MPRWCAAVGCKEKDEKDSTYSFHRFPKNIVKRKAWLIKMNRCDPVEKTRLWEPKEHDRLCSKHFEDTCFVQSTLVKKSLGWKCKAQLKDDAVPTIFPHLKERQLRPQCGLTKRRKIETLDEIMREYSASAETDVTETTAQDLHLEVEIAKQDKPSKTLDEIKREYSASAETDVTETTEQDLHLEMETAKQDKQIQVNLEPVINKASAKVQTLRLKSVTREIQTEAGEHICLCHCKQQATELKSVESQTDIFRSAVLDENDPDDEVSDDEESEPEEDINHSASKCNWDATQNENRQTLREDLNNANPFAERKFIVFESHLTQLLNVCRACSQPCQISNKGECGTSVEFNCICACGHRFNWNSQPFSKRLPLGNLVLAAAAFFTACSPTRLLKALQHSNVACFSLKTYNNVQSSYLVPAVRNIWNRCQAQLISARQGTAVKLAGDGRCDSPGHSAKYGSYSLMDASTSEVLHMELIQSNQVQSSQAMELKGLQAGLQQIKELVTISHLITDRHPSIKKYMREKEPAITHYFDIWHMSKGVGKKISKASKSKASVQLALWQKSICNHMYWCSVSTSEDDPDRQEIIKEKWVSIANHVADIHSGHGNRFPQCAHGDLEGRVWIRKGSRQHRILENIIKNPFLLKDVGKMSGNEQTSALESFHAVMCHFAPKLNHFKFSVMQAKLYLAAIHFNANAGRKQATTQDGELQWKVARPRAVKGNPVVKAVKEKISQDYIRELYEEVVMLRLTYPSYKRAKTAQADVEQAMPETLSESAGVVDKAALVAKHCSRYSR